MQYILKQYCRRKDVIAPLLIAHQSLTGKRLHQTTLIALNDTNAGREREQKSMH